MNKNDCWAARDFNGNLFVYSTKPILNTQTGEWMAKDTKTQVMYVPRYFADIWALTSVSANKPIRVQLLNDVGR